jgi:hypothetical protein
MKLHNTTGMSLLIDGTGRPRTTKMPVERQRQSHNSQEMYQKPNRTNFMMVVVAVTKHMLSEIANASFIT